MKEDLETVKKTMQSKEVELLSVQVQSDPYIWPCVSC